MLLFCKCALANDKFCGDAFDHLDRRILFENVPHHLHGPFDQQIRIAADFCHGGSGTRLYAEPFKVIVSD